MSIGVSQTYEVTVGTFHFDGVSSMNLNQVSIVVTEFGISSNNNCGLSSWVWLRWISCLGWVLLRGILGRYSLGWLSLHIDIYLRNKIILLLVLSNICSLFANRIITLVLFSNHTFYSTWGFG